jgi:hypothetical protein
MENKINIAELLEGCPKGMELYSPIFGKVYLDKVGPHLGIVVATDKYKEEFLYDGRYGMNGECMLFPSKEKTTWEGFQRTFMDGDVVATTDGRWIGITTGGEKGQFIPTYCVIQCDDKFEAYLDRKGEWAFNRLATKEEKAKLFQAIKDNGYYWNAETKTLEKAIQPKFKDGDILFVKATYSWIIIYKESENEGGLYKYVGIPVGIPDYPDYTFMVYDCNPLCCKDDISEIRLATEEEKKKLFDAIKENGYMWNPETKTLEKLPKFKVGDKIRHKINNDIYEISAVYDGFYGLVDYAFMLNMKYQDDYKLVQNKFDITTLKPFESKVLMRSSNAMKWTATFYSHKEGEYFAGCGLYCKQCIPYEGNEHLLSTINDCDEYYKTWE